MSGLFALTGPLWAWLGLEFVLSAILWAVYRLLRRHLGTAAERFLFLKLGLVALILLPFVPAGLPSPWSGRLPSAWPVLLTAPRHAVAMAMTPAAHSRPGWLGVIADVGAALYLTWVAGCLLRLVVAMRRLHKLIRSAEVLTMAGSTPVLLHAGELAPATVGILRPRILIPRRLYQTLSPRDVQLIICHEAVHIRRHDALFNALVVLLRQVLVFSPFIRALGRHFASEMELSVDAAVLSQADIAPREYGHLLLALATQLRASPVDSGLFVARSLITKRIAAMSRPASGKSRKTLLVASLIAVAGLCGSGISALRLGPAAWAATEPHRLSVPAERAQQLLQLFLVEPGGTRSIAQEDGTLLSLSAMPIVTGSDLDSAMVQDGDQPSLSIHLKPAAAAKFSAFTGSHLGQRMAIVLAGKLVAAPVIKAKIDGGSLVLSGDFKDVMGRLVEAINAGRPAAAPNSR